ncbi:MAG: heavy metal translocating P-type ATPase [Proteobacteria bacterium]|nr:heavy metal translocating P-type ATPase [Pseudomonadota bacterium]
MPQISGCPHCAAPVEGDEGTFCCSGCELAYAVLSDAGLQGHYLEREVPGLRPLPPVRRDWSLVALTEHDGSCEAVLAVDGLTCASCVSVAEALLERQDGVQAAEVSFATGKARVRFDPTAITLDDHARTLARVGYTLRPVAAEPTVDHDPLVRLGIALFCAANVMGLSIPIYLGWLEGMDLRFERLFAWGSLLLATPATLVAAAPFFRSAWHGLTARTLHMDLPLALAIGGLYVHGIYATLAHSEAYFDSLTMLIALLLVGRALEARGQRNAASAADLLGSALPGVVTRVEALGDAVVPTSDLRVGDRVRMTGGDTVPGDGIIDQGEGRASLALVTGESVPVPAIPGTQLPAGAELLDGDIVLRVREMGAGTLIGQMQAALTQTSTSRNPTQADRLAPAFTAATILLGLAALALTPWIGSAEAMRRAVAVWVVACPCALSLARPLAVSAALSGLARRGLWLRSGDALLALNDVRTVALDKTGTLTEAQARVVSAEDEALRIAAALEVGSSHPIARAIVSEAVGRGIPLPRAAEIEEVRGQGVRGSVDGRLWEVRSAGVDAVRVVSDDLEHLIRLAHVPRASAGPALQELQTTGIDLRILTGDRAEAASRLAEQLNIPASAVHAELSPLEKVDLVDAHTAFVGDGLNDGPALAAAAVGLAVAHGAPSSIAAADGVVRAGALGVLTDALRTARRTQRTISANLVRSAAYNVLAVAAAMAGLVNPLVAAILMPISSLLVLATSAKLAKGDA